MDKDTVVSLGTQAMELALKIGLPLLLAGLVVGLVISVFQAVTQIQEQTLTFIPKILVTVAVIVIAGPWMLDQLLVYTTELWQSIPTTAAPSN
jgi:flagellar biosynthetic protein FliQ